MINESLMIDQACITSINANCSECMPYTNDKGSQMIWGLMNAKTSHSFVSTHLHNVARVLLYRYLGHNEMCLDFKLKHTYLHHHR